MTLPSIPYGRQNISSEDIQCLDEVLKSDFLTQGPRVTEFESKIAEYCGARYAVAVCNATAALHLACLVLDLKAGQSLWTSPITFVASANCGLYCGGSVDFLDIDPKTYNLSAVELETKLERAKDQGRLPRIVIPVHLAGQSCEMEKISQLSKKYGFTVIEDASHAIGGSYRGSKIGSCLYSDMTVFSFHPVKVMTTGEGGVITTNREDLYQRLLRLRSHGLTRDPALMEGPSHGPWYYQQIDLGFNYRMTDIQAALGISQLRRLDGFVTRRHELVENYNRAFANLPVVTPWQDPETYSAFHLYIIRLKTNQIKKSHREVFESMRKEGIEVNLHYIPVHTQPYYQRLGFHLGDFPESERYYSEAITLPLYYDLSAESQNRVIESLKNAVS